MPCRPLRDKGIALRQVAGHADVFCRDRHLCAARRRWRSPSRARSPGQCFVRSRIRPWMRSRSAARFCGELDDQVANARRAAATAMATSCALPKAISAMGCSVDGSTTALRARPAGRTHSPPMKMRSRRPASARCLMRSVFMWGIVAAVWRCGSDVLWIRRRSDVAIAACSRRADVLTCARERAKTAVYGPSNGTPCGVHRVRLAQR